jgi:hypothetical protein
LPASTLSNTGLGAGGGLVSGYVQSLQYLKTAMEVLGVQPEWYQQNDKLIVLGLAQSGITSALVEYKPHDFTVSQLQERDHDLVKRKALAFAKHFVGLVRTTASSFPGADGQQIPLNGDKMLEEAEKEQELLEEEIFNSAAPMGFMVG